MKYGFSLALFPTSWGIGCKRIRGKTLLAFGPLRFVLHRVEGSWADCDRRIPPDIARLAATILHAGIGEPSQNESAIDTAIRLIKGMGANARAKVNHD